MKQFIAFVRKEFSHILRDRRTLLIILGIPVVQIVLFGFAITTEVNNIRVAVLDPSNDVSTQRIIHQLDASKYFKVSETIHDPAQIETLFQKGKADLAIVFCENFDERIRHTEDASVQLIADATDPNTATQLTQYAVNILNEYRQQISYGQTVPFQIIPEIKLLYNPQIKSAYNFVPGVMGLILILICAMMTSISIVREKETGTMEVLLVSPMKPIFIIIAKAVPYLVLSCVNLVTILLLSVYLLDVPVAGSLFWLGVVSILFIFVALSLGLLISTVAQSQVAAMLISGMGLIMPVMLLSGMIYPTENMPWILQRISDIIPAKWYIQAVKKLMIEGLGVSYILKELSILAVMALVLMTVSLKKFKVRL